MITEATVKNVRFPPELLPDSWFGNILLGAEFAPPVLDLRRFKPYILGLANIQVTANVNVELRTRYDDLRVQENTGAMISALVGAWRLTAKDILYYNLFGVAAAPVANYTTHFGIWAYPPTVAHKLLYGITLTREENALAESLGLYNSVEKGVLPLPISQQIEREYHILGEETHSRSVNIAVANTVYTIETIYPRTNEFLVLTRLAAAPGTAAQDIQLLVDRDDDSNYGQLKTFPLSLVAGGEVECFIPAMREIRLTTSATVAPGAHLFRYSFIRCRLTNLLRVRFGLVSEDEVPAELFKKVQGGIL